MYSHDGTWDFLKLASVLVFIGVGVWWLQSVIGQDYTVLVIFALIGVILFAGGALFAHMNQKQTLGAITKFNADDAQIDRYRQQSFKALAQGDAAMKRAAAQLQVIDARRVDRLASQQAKLLTDTERAKWEAQQQPAQADAWGWDSNDGDNGDSFQTWG